MADISSSILTVVIVLSYTTLHCTAYHSNLFIYLSIWSVLLIAASAAPASRIPCLQLHLALHVFCWKPTYMNLEVSPPLALA